MKSFRKRITSIALALLLVLGTVATSSPANADAPLAARLLAEPYQTTGIRINLDGLGSNMRGLATDGSTAFVMNGSGNVMTVPLSSIDMTPAQSPQTVSGDMHSVGWGDDGAPSLPGNINQLSMSYSHGCLFMTDDSNSAGNIKLYCIDVSDWSVTEIEVPDDKPLPTGSYWTHSNMIDFPDGRIGKVSGYTKQGDHYYTSTLRTYTVTGTGKDVAIEWSHDYVMQDTSTEYNDGAGWARDEHGIGTDGTYLYRIQWNTVVPNTKVWALTGDNSEAEVVYGGSYTMPYGNMHYLAHNHIDHYYMMGNYDGQNIFITTAADPGPGPGNPDTTAPVITSLSPADNATDVPTDLDILAITFNEPIVNGPPSGDLNKLVIRRASDNVAVYTMGAHETLVNISGNTAVFDVASVTGLQPGTAYYVQFGSGAFRDASGNYHAGIDDTTTWNFTTAGAPNAPSDDDEDGVSAEEETGAPHGGDGNNDGHPDAEQSYVASFVDARTNKYITLAVDASCELSNVFANSESNHVAKDAGYNYTSGFVNFTATGCDNGKSDVKLYYHGVAPGDVTVRKYNPNTKAYFTVSAATITAAPAPLSGTLVSYTIVDDGDLDIDKTPGVIVDPIGLGQLAVGAPNTGLGARR